MDFRYVALDKNKNKISGVLNEESEASSIGQLKKLGLIPITVKQVKSKKSKAEAKRSFFCVNRVSIRELAIFSRQLSSCLNAGLLLTDSLDTMRDDLENAYFRHIIREIVEDIRAGLKFSSALAKYPNIFSVAYVAMIKAGEEIGALDKTLSSLAKYLEDTERLNQKIKSATRYPLFITSFFLLVVFVIVFFIIPKFTAMFFQAGAKMPMLTRIVVGISEVALKNIPSLIVVVTVLFVSLWLALKIPKIRLSFDSLKFKIPLFGKLMQKAMVSRFCRTLSILTAGGTTLITSLKICSEINNNVYLKKIIEFIRERIISGNSFSNEVKGQLIFPRMVVKMAQVGEKTGKISEMLKRSADYYDEELEIAIYNLTSTLEPTLIILIGGVVLIVVLALYLPIFNLALAVR